MTKLFTLPEGRSQIGSRDTTLSDLRVAFGAEFCIVSENDDVDAASSVALGAFEDMFGTQNVIFNTDLYGNEALDALSEDTSPANFMLADTPLHNRDFGDPDDLDNVYHFFCLVSKPSRIETFRPNLMSLTDRLTGEPLLTTSVTRLNIRIGNTATGKKISPLALALHSDDMGWFKMSGRPHGRVFEEDNWVQGILKDAIIQKALRGDEYLSKETSTEAWIDILERAAFEVIMDDEGPATVVSEDLQFADFSHLSGEGYQTDSAALLNCIEEMAISTHKSLVSDPDAYWNRLENRRLLLDFIDFILDIQNKSEEVEIRQIEGIQSVPSYRIFMGSSEIGKLQRFASRSAEDDFDNSVVRVGSICQFVSSGRACKTTAALLHKRLAYSAD